MRSLILCVVAGFLLPAFAPADEGSPLREESGLVFGKGGDADLMLDLAMPADGDGPFPAVVCVHGGGWVGGDRKQMDQTIHALAHRGYVAVSPDYRLAPHDRFPAPVEDCKAAVRWLRANAAKYKIDADHIGAVGFASGGHLACLLGLTVKADGLEGTGGNAEQSSRVQAVVSFFAPTDLAAKGWGPDVEGKNLVPLLGGTADERPEAYRKASPLTYAGKNGAPLLLIHGAEDKMVPVGQARKLYDKIAAAGGAAELVVVEGEGHGFRPEKLRPCLVQMMTFFDKRLKP